MLNKKELKVKKYEYIILDFYMYDMCIESFLKIKFFNICK